MSYYCYPKHCYSYQCFDYDTCLCRTKGYCNNDSQGPSIISIIFPILFGIFLIVAIVSYCLRRRRLRQLATQGRVVNIRPLNSSLHLQSHTQSAYNDPPGFHPQILEAKVEPFPSERGQVPTNLGGQIQYPPGYVPSNNTSMMMPGHDQSGFGFNNYNNQVIMGAPVYVQPQQPTYYNTYGEY